MQTTSLEAYNKIKPLRNKDYKAILVALKSYPKITYNEIALILQWQNPNKVSRRTSEMIKLNLIDKVGERICTIAKSKCSIYSVKKVVD